MTFLGCLLSIRNTEVSMCLFSLLFGKELSKNHASYFRESPISWSFHAELYQTQYFSYHLGQSRASWTLHLLMGPTLDPWEFVNICDIMNNTAEIKDSFLNCFSAKQFNCVLFLWGRIRMASSYWSLRHCGFRGMLLRPFLLEVHMDHKALSFFFFSSCIISLMNLIALLSVEVWRLSWWEKWLVTAFHFNFVEEKQWCSPGKESHIARKACIFFPSNHCISVLSNPF